MRIWETFTNQKQWENYLKDLLKRNRIALIKAALIIYNNQTELEKNNFESSEENRIGFDKYDAGTLTKICKKLENGKYISENELYLLRSRIPRYWKQLMNHIKKEMHKDTILSYWKNNILRRFENVY